MYYNEIPMLLALDIGNSNIVVGLFNTDELIQTFRIETKKHETENHYQQQLSSLPESHISDVVIGSVVPELDSIFTSIFERQMIRPLFVSTQLRSNIPNLSEKSTALGADRLADCVTAIEKYEGNRIVVDVGTATKFEVISENNEYKGGAISPGVGVSFDALLQSASKLSKITLSPPKKVVGGFSTEEHLDSGYIYGFASMIDGMIHKINAEMKWEKSTVILTGGFTDTLSPFIKTKVEINKNLTLEGLRILWQMNR